MNKLDDITVGKLKEPFTDNKVCVKVQSISKDGTRALIVKYLQHTDVADRLDDVDPEWSSEIIKDGSGADSQGDRAVYCHMKLTVCGISREGVGDGQDPKSAASDALKRCAMLFGVGRYLYDEEPVWTDYSEDRDRRRVWTVDDYERARLAEEPPQVRARGSSRGREPVGNPRPVQTKAELVRKVRELQDHLKVSERDLISWARECTGVSPDKMDVSQLEKFVGELLFDARKAGYRG